MKTKPIFIIGLLVLSMMTFNSDFVSACSCIMPAPPRESLENSYSVFTGKVIDIEKPRIMETSLDPVKVTFEVSKVYKGEEQEKITIQTALYSASCGFEFELYKNYIVYTYESEGIIETGLCTRTSLLENAQEDIQELDNIPVGCTKEAKICPDGSTVGRVPPKCEFEACPNETAIKSFQECIDAGNPIMESYPRQCKTSEGKTFVENIPNDNEEPIYESPKNIFTRFFDWLRNIFS